LICDVVGGAECREPGVRVARRRPRFRGIVIGYKSCEKAASGHVVHWVQEGSKTASKGAKTGSHGPGNER
jgi:hypothetical protein